MKVIVPMTVDDSNLDTSSIAEDDYAAWNSGTTYDADEYVISVTTHKVYMSVVGSNLNNDPTTDDGTWWLEVGATNRWKAFDQRLYDTAVMSGDYLTYSIVPDQLVTGIAFLNMNAIQVRVQVWDAPSGGEAIFNETVYMANQWVIVDWFTYFTEDLSTYETEYIFTDLPGYVNNRIDIRLGNGTGNPSVGQIVLGKVETLGFTQDGTSIGIRDFSVKERDVFGNAIITERAFADEVNFAFALYTSDARRVKSILTSLRATPTAYFADETIMNYGMTVYGFFQDFSIPIKAGNISYATLDIEGLV